MDRTDCFKCVYLKFLRAKESGTIFFFCTHNKRVMGKYKQKIKLLKRPKPITGVPCKRRDKANKKPFFLFRLFTWLTRNKGKKGGN